MEADARQLLERRAARYARPAVPEPREVTEAMTFTRAEGLYALPLRSLREVCPLRHLARVPGTSAVVAGVFQFRGELLGAHDLGHWLGRGGGARPGWVLVVEHGGARLGLLADDVAGLERIAGEQLGPVPVTLGERGVCFRGVFGAQRLLLEPERLFSTPAFFRAF